MKRKMAVVFSLICALTVGGTAVAAPSPSIQNEPVAQVVVNSSLGNNALGAVQMNGVMGEKTAVLPGTTFVTAGGQTVDPAAVALVISPSTAEVAHTAAAGLSAAFTSEAIQVVNFTGRQGLSLTDSRNRLNIVNNMTVSLVTASGEVVSHNGSLSAAFSLADILNGTVLAEGETLQALYQRANGTWVAVPVVISNGVLAIALPAFGGSVNVTFVIAKGAAMGAVPAAASTSPRT